MIDWVFLLEWCATVALGTAVGNIIAYALHADVIGEKLRDWIFRRPKK